MKTRRELANFVDLLVRKCGLKLTHLRLPIEFVFKYDSQPLLHDVNGSSSAVHHIVSNFDDYIILKNKKKTKLNEIHNNRSIYVFKSYYYT